jgi:hypothetical protein
VRRKKEVYLVDQARQKAIEYKKVKHVGRVNMIKKALDVKEDCKCHLLVRVQN